MSSKMSLSAFFRASVKIGFTLAHTARKILVAEIKNYKIIIIMTSIRFNNIFENYWYNYNIFSPPLLSCKQNDKLLIIQRKVNKK